MAVHTVKLDFQGREYSLETGKLAKFANGSVMVRCGDTMVLVCVVAAQVEKENIDFLPLQVEYREKMAAAGKFPGGFLKREGRPSEKEILVSRLIDRPCRPMFSKDWHRETQIIAQVFSAEPDVDPENLALVGASAALLISDIPFNGPISEVRVGRIDGQFIANPSIEQLKSCDIDITIAGSDSSIVMVEGESNEISEEEFLSALEFGHERIKELNSLQNQLAALTSQAKNPIIDKSIPSDFVEAIYNEISTDLKAYVYAITTKAERSLKRAELSERAKLIANEKFAEDERFTDRIEALASMAFGKLEKKVMREMILVDHKRLDGRGLTDIRPISIEAGLLPRNHGSALFTRGETQSLTSLTLGTTRDEQMIDGLLPTYTNKFYLHYNFPPLSVGEVGRYSGTGRREIGHGNLAERALKKVLPDDSFPYTMRVVSDILESNGSSSMATVCAGSLAMFDAGVPLKKAVAGIAMGLIKEDDRVAILSDILGDEDFLGDMDFKVAGTKDGITACQMDIKIEGLSLELMKTALDQAKHGRMHILSKMNEVLDAPREELSRYAPRFTVMNIPKDTIGAVIGPGGETIRGIIRETGVEINIDDDGKVTVAATSKEANDAAMVIIRQITAKPSVGDVYQAKVKEVRDGLGAIMEFMPGKQGLLHISEISYKRVERVEDEIKEGEILEVKLIEVTRDGKYRLSRKALLPKPEGFVERTNDRPSNGDRGNDRGFDRRNDRGGDRNNDRNRR